MCEFLVGALDGHRMLIDQNPPWLSVPSRSGELCEVDIQDPP
ncbi:hypothetical protein P3T21_007725 [Paraburkholderia sp. GAS334]